MTALSLELGHPEMGLAPVADAFAGTVASDVVNMKDHNRVRFTVLKGAGALGTQALTVEACDDTTPSNTSAIPFTYRVTAAGGAPGAITDADATGFTTAAGANQIIEIEVAAQALLASGYTYVRLKSVEGVNDPVVGAILINMLEPRNAGLSHASAVV